MTLYVHLPLADDTHRERLRTLAREAGRTVHFADPDGPADDDARALADAEVALGNCPPEWLAAAPRLRWLQLASVGVDAYLGLDWHAAPLDGLTVTNLRGVFADPVAETCLAGILAHLRGVDTLVAARPDRAWQRARLRPRLRLLTGARVLVLGTGAIARRLAALLAPFGCDLVHYGRSAGELRTLRELDAQLPTADVVVALLPDTPATRGLFDARRLALLRPTALFVNAGRGSVVDEDALLAALADGALGGAVLDVTRREPLPPDDPLWRAPRTILTQHTAGGSEEETTRVIDVFADNWRRRAAGRPLVNVVDWSKGY
ncbi:D-2-hydroxyacid dehydrogenase [Streptomyces sp. 4N509B]|uniref:D-2-hydroxyacid dehydrogenase n=1 Tax=Streptomyces sp. 4N509B TaxID=3457413 RepID=UPI003FD3EFB1